MPDPEVVDETKTETGPDPREMFLQMQEAQIKAARDAEQLNRVIMLELLRDNEDKGVYRDAATGASVTVLDGDSESIKPYLENLHTRMLEEHGGVDALIEHRREQFDQAVTDGRMSQEAADKMIELLQDAGTDSAAYAQARFDSNAFFAEQAVASGLDPSKVNDYTVSTSVVVHREIGADAETVEAANAEAQQTLTDLEITPSNVEDSGTFIKVANGNDLTEAGKLLIISDAMAGLGVPNPIDMVKQNFDQMLQQHGSVDALATHLETNMSELIDDSSLTEEGKAQVLEAVRNSDGDSAKFVASMFNNIEGLSTGATVTDPAAETQQRTAAEDLALRREQAMRDGDFAALAAIQLQEVANALAGGSVVDGGTGTVSRAPVANAQEDQGVTVEQAAEIEDRAMDIAAQTLKDSSEMQAYRAQIEEIKAELGSSEHADWHSRTQEIFQNMGAIMDQVKADARVYAANEAGVELAQVYPDLVPENPPTGGEPEVTGEDATVADATAETVVQQTATIQPDAIDVSDQTVVEPTVEASVDAGLQTETPEEGVEVEVSMADPEEDKGYVTNPHGGPVTYEVAGSVATGEPIRSEDGALYSFADGTGLSTGFSSASDPDPTQIAMVDPFQEAMQALDRIGYGNDSRMTLGTMSA